MKADLKQRARVTGRGVLAAAAVAAAVAWPNWREGLAEVSYCKSSRDCGSGEVCVVISINGEAASSKGGSCDPAGCQSDSDCGAGETCRSIGAGQPNRCTTSIGSDEDDIIRTDPGPGPTASADTARPPRPVPPPPAARPAEQPRQAPPPPIKPELTRKAQPVKIYVILLGGGNVDARQVILARRRLEQALDAAFEGTAGYEIVSRDPSDPNRHKTNAREITLYLASGEKAPEKLFTDHGYRLDPGGQQVLRDAFAPNSPVRGASTGRVGVVNLDKLNAPDEPFALSDAMTHEVGHALVPNLCPHTNPPTASPNPAACTGAMSPENQGQVQRGYSAEFAAEVKRHFPLTLTAAPRYTAVWEPSTEGEIQLYGWTEQDLRAKSDELWTAGWRIAQLSAYAVDDQVRYVAVFRARTEPRALVRETRGGHQRTLLGGKDEVQLFGASFEEFRTQYDRLWKQGWRIKLIAPYVVNGLVRYSAIWEPGLQAETQLYNVSAAQLREEYERRFAEGWRLRLVSAYVHNGDARFVAVFERSPQAGQIALFGAPYEQFRAEYDRLWAEGWRLRLMSTAPVRGITRYTAVWQRDGSSEVQLYDAPYEEFRPQYDLLWDLGWRLKLLSVS